MQGFTGNQPTDVVAAIDIGTTKVCALVGRKKPIRKNGNSRNRQSRVRRSYAWRCN